MAPVDEAQYSLGLYFVLGSWTEATITWNNQPNSTGAPYIAWDSTVAPLPAPGWNHCNFSAQGVSYLQQAFDIGVFYGLSLYADARTV